MPEPIRLINQKFCVVPDIFYFALSLGYITVVKDYDSITDEVLGAHFVKT